MIKDKSSNSHLFTSDKIVKTRILKIKGSELLFSLLNLIILEMFNNCLFISTTFDKYLVYISKLVILTFGKEEITSGELGLISCILS